MDLPVHTGLLRLERRLYQVGDLELPAPVTLAEAGVFVASLGLLIAVSRLLGLGLNPSWAWTYVVVPWLVMRAGTGLIADRKRLHQWALSQLRYLLAEPRLLARLEPVREPAVARLRVRVWRRRPQRQMVATRRWQAMSSLERFRLEVEGRGTSSEPASSSPDWQPRGVRPERWPANGRRVGGGR